VIAVTICYTIPKKAFPAISPISRPAGTNVEAIEAGTIQQWKNLERFQVEIAGADPWSLNRIGAHYGLLK
jgi:hypothetical protein